MSLFVVNVFPINRLVYKMSQIVKNIQFFFESLVLFDQQSKNQKILSLQRYKSEVCGERDTREQLEVLFDKWLINNKDGCR